MVCRISQTCKRHSLPSTCFCKICIRTCWCPGLNFRRQVKYLQTRNKAVLSRIESGLTREYLGAYARFHTHTLAMVKDRSLTTESLMPWTMPLHPSIRPQALQDIQHTLAMMSVTKSKDPIQRALVHFRIDNIFRRWSFKHGWFPNMRPIFLWLIQNEYQNKHKWKGCFQEMKLKLHL